MKHIVITLLILCLGITAEAQSFSITDGDSIYTGFRASRLYHIYPDHEFPPKEYWLKVGNEMTAKFENARPAGIWIVGLYQDNGTVALGFPSPGGSYDKITFATTDQNEEYLSYFDENNLKVWLQVEPGSADIDTLMHLVLDRYKQHPSVIGFGIDIEWYKADVYDEGAHVSNEEAEHWENTLHEIDTTYSLFIKHYNTRWMPPDYRGNIFFVDDSQDFNWGSDHLQLMVDEYRDWGATFSPNASGFQFGYPADRNWWSAYDDPPQTIGQALLDNIPECKGIFWVDFTVTEIFPLGINEHAYENSNLKMLAVLPNPVTERSKIRFKLEKRETVTVRVTDVSGRTVLLMPGKKFSQGEHRIGFQNTSLKPGIYLLTLQAGNELLTAKFLVNRQ
jgi:hypothetical protein